MASQLALTPDELLTTRSVRKRLDFTRPVERTVIEECLSMAQHAPTGSNLQNWSFVVVTDPAKRLALAEVYRKGWAIYETLPIAAGNLRFADADRNDQQARVMASARYLAQLTPSATGFLARRKPVQFILRGLRSLSLFLLLIGAGIVYPVAAQSSDNACTWKGTNSSQWTDGNNWSCPNGGIPTADNVAIIGGAPIAPSVNSNITVKGIRLNGGTLYIGTAVTVTGAGSVDVNGGIIQNNGTIAMPLNVISGVFETSGRWERSMTVSPLAEVRVRFGTMTVTGDVLNQGLLSGLNGGMTFVFTSVTFRNDGEVRVGATAFGGSGVQTLSGNGAWTGLTGIVIQPGSTTTLANDLLLKTGVTVNGGGTLAIGSHTLTLNGGVLFASMCTGAGAVTGTGKLRAEVAVTLSSCGPFSPEVEVASGMIKANGSFDGKLHVLPAATLQVQGGSLTPNGTLTVDGQLTGGTLLFKGQTLTNTGTISLTSVSFARSGQQSLGGGGRWQGKGQVTVNSGSTTTLLGDPLFTSNVTIVGGGVLDVSSHTLTISGTLTLASQCAGSGAVNGGQGKIRTQGVVTLNLCGPFTAGLEVAQGTALAAGTLGGATNVLKGATLRPLNSAFTASGDLTVSGLLTGTTGSLTFAGNSKSFTNDGQVTIGNTFFTGVKQTLKGSGLFVGNNVTVQPNAVLALGSDHRLNKLTVTATAKLDLAKYKLSLAASGAPLVNNGALLTPGSTIIYNGSAAQTLVNQNVNYHSLTIKNNAGVTAPTTNVNVAGDFTNNGLFKANNGTLTFNGDGAQTLSGNTTTFVNLVITNTKGVTVSSDLTVTGKLGLGGDLRTNNHVVYLSGTATGDYDVFGVTVRRGLTRATTYSFGSPYVTVRFAPSGTVPASLAVALVGNVLDIAQGVRRTYVISPTGGNAYSATLRLHYRDSELSNLNEPKLQLWQRPIMSQPWALVTATSANTTTNWLERSGVKSFGQWTIGPTHATITIVLDSLPEDKRNVSFRSDFGSFMLDDWPLDDDAIVNSKTIDVPAGRYVVTQTTVTTGWRLANIICDPTAKGAVDVAGRKVTLNVVHGDNVTCTFFNQQGAATPKAEVNSAEALDATSVAFAGAQAIYLPLIATADPNLEATKVGDGESRANPGIVTATPGMTSDAEANLQPQTVYLPLISTNRP